MLRVPIGFSIISAIISFPAWAFQRKRVHWYPWDYGVPIYGMFLWMILVLSGIGSPHGFINFFWEALCICIVSAISPWLRVIFPGKDDKSSILSSLLFMFLPIIVAIALRLFMPSLPGGY